jgi:hypothetical protein
MKIKDKLIEWKNKHQLLCLILGIIFFPVLFPVVILVFILALLMGSIIDMVAGLFGLSKYEIDSCGD